MIKQKNIFTSVTINDCHMLRDLGLALARTDCVKPPEPKTVIQDIPGADGVIDLTESLVGHTVYNNREIRMEFGRGMERNQWPGMYSKIMGMFHGKQVRVIFDDDPDYFYSGRASVSDYARAQTLGTMVITVDAEPYKQEINGGLEPWKWGPLNFRTGIIRNYQNLLVEGRREVKIPGRSKVVIPIIISSAAMTVEWKGKQYDLVAGNNKIYDIAIPEGENFLTFIGNGTVSIDYRGGIL